MMYSNYDGATYNLHGSYGEPPAVSFVSPSSYYGDPTRVFDSSGDEKLVGNQVIGPSGTSAIIPTNDKAGSEDGTIGFLQMAKDVGVVLLSYLLGVEEKEDYYNPKPLDNTSKRKEETSDTLEFIQPLMVGN